MKPEREDDLLDRLVGEFSDHLAAGRDPQEAELFARVPAQQHETLRRCLRMVRAGLVPAPRSTEALVPGLELDGFRILRELGRGGMAVVYLADQLELRRKVALKVLRPGLALDARHVDRFKREALTIARLQHPHIVQVHAVGETRGYHWLAMEFVEGPTLSEVLDRIAQGGRPCGQWTAADLARATGLPALGGYESYERALCALLAPVARALGTAHDLGLVHRDVKPSNILIQRDGRALIADFGLAKGQGDPGLSLSGQPVGTPYYMSPEQAEMSTRSVDQRSDVYSFGVTLYESLCGRRPFEGDTVLAVLDAIKSRAPTPLRALAPRRSRDAQAVVRRAMAYAPADRYASAIELSAELGALVEGRATQALAQEGGALRRAWRFWRLAAAGQIQEYRSPHTFLGLPLVHFCFGRRFPGQKRRVAKGWLAAGDVAIGGLAFGGVAIGLCSFGGLGLGLLLGWGGIASGALCMGGIALGILPLGGLAIGYGAFGGLAIGHYAMGGRVYGNHLLGEGHHDPRAEQWFADWAPWIALFFAGHGGG